MTLPGIVKDGVVVLDNGHKLAEGLRVEVLVPETLSEPVSTATPTLSGLLAIAGRVTNLPADFAEQHDHYLHGTPRR